MINVTDGLTMTLECVFLLLDGGAWIEIFHSNATFYRGRCVTCKDISAMSRDHRSHGSTLAISHAGQSTCHEFEAAFARLSWRIHLPDVVYMEQSAGHRNHQIVIYEIHIVYPLRKFVRGLLRRRSSRIPEAHCTVPRASNHRVLEVHVFSYDGMGKRQNAH